MSFDKPCYILGAGGHAKTLIDALKSQNAEIVGCLDPQKKEGETVIAGVKILGGDQILDTLNSEGIYLFNGIGSVKEPDIRKAVFEKYKARGFSFPPVAHTTAYLGSDTTLGDGCVIQAGAIIQAGSSLAENIIINTKASIDHDCKIGSHTHIAPAATLCGAVKVGAETHIGAGAVIIQNIEIGDRVIIGAGVIVKENMPSGTVIS